MNNRIKAEIEYLRQWLITALLSSIGTLGWAFTYDKIDIRLYLSLFGFTFSFLGVIIIHIKIKNLFKQWK